MASWLDQLRPASWRGVGFKMDSSEIVSGDAVVVRDYPFGELPIVYRMGEAAERIRVSAYVVGDDYAIQRDALRRVLTGEGELILPTMGVIKAHVAGQYTMREAPLREGCVVRFDLQFVRAELRPSVTELASTQADAVLAATNTKDAAVANYVAELEATVKTLPSFAADEYKDKVANSLELAMGKIGPAANAVNAVSDTLAGAYQAARAGLDTVVAQPVALVSALRELFNLPSDIATSAKAALRDAYYTVVGLSGSVSRPSWQQVVQPAPGKLAIFGMGAASVPVAQTPTRKAMQRLDVATDRFFDSLALAAWVESLAGDDMASYDQAVVWRGQLYAAVQKLLTDASTDPASAALPSADWHSALLALLTKGSADLQRRGRDQSRVTQWTPKAWMSIWAISYELYGTAQWADEIADMNPDIDNPLLVPPGKPLRVARHA